VEMRWRRSGRHRHGENGPTTSDLQSVSLPHLGIGQKATDCDIEYYFYTYHDVRIAGNQPRFWNSKYGAYKGMGKHVDDLDVTARTAYFGYVNF
jgi:hypothetical protein